MKCFIRPDIFPHHLVDEINSLNDVLGLETNLSDSYVFDVILNNERLEIPYRTYVNIPAEDLFQNLSIRQQQILSCFLTRHHNGFVRKQYLKRVIKIHEPWVVPFISQLIGEYVVEILFEISKNLVYLDIKEFNKFFDDNREFFFRTKQRVRSYWNCYYKNEYKEFEAYIGNKVITYFEGYPGRGNYT
ncbi:hypothetical protein [Cohnella terricola]|uniref:Uncharacterized protein n=1 Tax=Cohnella terricola TaxID=1289167 RepID=A0A559IV94_9BACL|nr:hypothetical protein [Cohnella terricola]TVX91513.1 hypothetical protein FPZ45_24910 [Cohnella terricola]